MLEVRGHLDKTLVEATARINGNWLGDVQAYDSVVDNVLRLSDTLSDGIATQFPAEIR